MFFTFFSPLLRPFEVWLFPAALLEQGDTSEAKTEETKPRTHFCLFFLSFFIIYLFIYLTKKVIQMGNNYLLL